MLTEMFFAFWIVTVAVPRVPSTIDVADTVMTGLDGTDAGAVYKPLAEMDPQAKPEHPVPDTLQVTIPLYVPVTDAENCC